MKAPTPADEEARQRNLDAYRILDSPPERAYDEVVGLAAQICDTPMAVITLIDHDRQWFKARVGLDVDQTERDLAFCAHAILEPAAMTEVRDATQDPRFADNPLVTGDPKIRFYAGAPLVTPEGHALGTLCVIDRVPRTLTPQQRESLRMLAQEVMAHLALRRRLEEASNANVLLGALAEAQSTFIIGGDPRATFRRLLDLLLTLTDSEYGFIGEVLHGEDGAPYVRVVGHAISDISWDDATRALYREHEARGMEFRNLRALFGAALTSREVVIANDPAGDPRRGGLPPGHPAMNAFLGLPILVDGELIGLVGVANRPSGYDQALVDFLRPFVATCGTLIAAQRESARRRAAEAQLEAQNERLRELDALKDEVLASVSHELRTPLTSILAYLDLLRADLDLAGRLDGVEAEALEVIERNAQRLLYLVGDLLLFASIESNTIALRRTSVDVAAITRQAVEAARPRADARGVGVRLDVPQTVPAYADALRLSQVLDNLLSNAVKFSRPGGEVRVRLVADEATVIIEVADDGIGIPAADLPRLFERFARASNATRAAISGTGVGLAISRKLVEMHGGEVSVESTESVGSTFRVTIPRKKGAE